MAPFSAQFELALAIGAVSVLIFWTINTIIVPRGPMLRKDVKKCHELLSTTTLAKRAGTNRRLVVAFGIENGFTTTSEAVHDRFRTEIKKSLTLKNSDEARKELAQIISASAQDALREAIDTTQCIPLVNMARVAVFRTVLAIFFPDIPEIGDQDILLMASKMNSLWYDSKSPWKVFLAKYFQTRSSIIHDKQELHQKLQEVFPALQNLTRIEPSENPLNVLLPASVGLLRVVLRSLLEVRFRASETNLAEYRNLFRKFLQDPNGRWYKEENGLSVQHIIAETLRLYPPTRRIYMQQETDSIAVDIEQLHRTGNVWGEDPLRFDPKRWKREGLDVVNTSEYIPFGGKIGKPAKISRCPSRVRGGPKLIAIIVGVLLGLLDDDWCLLPIRKEEDFFWGEEPLRFGRDAYETLLLCRTRFESPPSDVSR